MNNQWLALSNDLNRSPLKGNIVACTSRENFQEALKKLLLSWLTAILSILIPVLHFVLVPGFFFLGIVLFLNEKKNTHRVVQALWTCPSCSAENQLKSQYLFDQKKTICSQCAVQIVFSNSQLH